MSELQKNSKNDTSSNSSLNIKEIITKLDTIFEENLSKSFQNIMIIPRQKFLNNIISTVKNFINEIYGNSIYNNDRFNNIFQSCLNNLEDRYNNYTEELEKTWEKYQNSKKIGNEESFFLSNFRKHCIKTDNLAIHKCQDGKFGYFIIVLKNIKNNSVNRRNKIPNIIHVQYIICNKCKTSFFSNKFINHCKSCNMNYLCSTMSYNEDPNLLLATWNPPHCETLANEKIHCMKCKENFLYLNMKTNMLQCQNRSCNYSISANSIETICTICNKNFKTNCKIYNPIEVLQIKEVIKTTLLIKKKAYPTSVPCCKDLDIKSIDFLHKKDCKGKLYLGELNQKSIIVCEKCKAINNLNKFCWTCPKCENRFKDNGNTKNLLNKFKNFNDNKVMKVIQPVKSFCSLNNSPIEYSNENNISTCNNTNNVITSYSVNIKNNNENINQNNKKRTLFYLIKSRKDKQNIVNNENKTIDNEYTKYMSNTHENITKGKSVSNKRNKLENKNLETINISNKKKYSQSKYLRKPCEIDIIKEELEPKWIISNKKLEDNNNPTKIDDKQINSNQNNITEFNPEDGIKSIQPRKNNYYNYRTHHNDSTNNTNKLKETTEDKSKEIAEINNKYNYYTRRRNKKYDSNTLDVNNLEKGKNKVIELNNNNYINSNNNINKELPTSSKYLFYKNKKNYLSQGNTFNENSSNIKDIIKHNRKSALTISTNEIETRKRNEKEINNNTASNIKLNCDINKKKHIFVSQDNIKKEEEKNERTISHRMRDKYKNKNKNNKTKETSIDTNTINTKQANTISRRRIRGYLRENEFKKNGFLIELNEYKNENQNEYKIETNIENKNEKNNEVNQNKGITIDQKQSNYHRYNQFNKNISKEKQAEEKDMRNSYSNNRYLNTNNNMNNYSTNNIKKCFENDSVNINLHKGVFGNHISSIYHSKKMNSGYLYEQKKNNFLNSNDANRQIIENEDKDKKERRELLNEIKKQLESQQLDTVNNQKRINNGISISVSNKLIVKDQNNKKLNIKFSKDVRKILSETKIPNFDINDYLIRRQIGEGGSGIIYEAYHKKSLKKYAIKKIIVPDLNALSEYKNEFEIVYANPHKNILVIFGIDIQYLDENNCAIYILMELADEDWNSVITKRFNTNLFYTEDQLVSILKQLTSLLCFLQKEKKIAHRDIKPENILVFSNEIYKISDFGEAKEKILSKQFNSLRGTELYMSPLLYQGLQEEKNNVKHNAYKSDVFSLGYCMIYASSLNSNLIYEIRNIESGVLLKRILNKYLGARYSNKFIDLLLKMIIFNEDRRVDFIELDKILNDEF